MNNIYKITILLWGQNNNNNNKFCSMNFTKQVYIYCFILKCLNYFKFISN